jgi:hypothetical protein
MKKLISFILLLSWHCSGSSQTLFNRTYGAYGAFNEAKSIQIMPDSGYSVLGSTGGWGANNGDMLLLKTDSIGRQLWAKVYGTTNSDKGISHIVLPDSGALLIGITNNTPDGDYDVLAIRINSAGEELWRRQFGHDGWEICTEIIQLFNGDFAISGTTFQAPFAKGAAFIWRISELGNLIWERTLEDGYPSTGSAICELSDHSLVMVGSGIQDSINKEDIQLSKWNLLGELLWVNYLGEELSEYALDLTSFPGGRIAIAGNKVDTDQFTKPYLFVVDEAGVVLNSYTNSSASENKIVNVVYNPELNSLVFGWDYISFSIPKASFYQFTTDLYYLCNVNLVGSQTSNIAGVSIPLKGGIIVCATIQSLAPGQSSILLMNSTSTCSFKTEISVGIENQQDFGTAFSYFPNPTAGSFFIKTPKPVSNIFCMDQLGRSVPISVSTQDKETKLDFPSGTSAGVYWVGISLKNQTETSWVKVVKLPD